VRSRTRLAAPPAPGRPLGIDRGKPRSDESPQLAFTASVSGHSFDDVIIQRQADDESAKAVVTPAPDVKPEAKPIDTPEPGPPKVLPASTDAQGTTTVKNPPLVIHDEYSGATLADVAAALPKEPGSASFEINAATESDPITKATVEVTQEVHLPRWVERDKQCAAVQKAWDAFYEAMKIHEDGHVSINQSAFANAHRRYAGKASSATQAVTDVIKREAKAAGDKFDDKTKHGLIANPPTVIDTSVSCPRAEGETSGADVAQAKLAVSQPGDPYELEADRMADQVMRMADPDAVPWPTVGAGRAAAQRKETGPGVAVPEEAAAVARSGGQPLDADTRAFMEPRFGFDFSRVRIHADAEAAEAARSINARAYTIGEDVVFDSGHFSPRSSEGQRLLAHELTHVVQQSGGSAAASIQASARQVHRAVKTLGGTWDTDTYTVKNDGTKDIGVSIDLKFVAADPVDAKQIGMVQTANSINEGKPFALNSTVKDRSIPKDEAGVTPGTHIDQLAEYKNPLYATGATAAGATLANTPTSASWGQHGWHYTDGAGLAQHQDAHLKDDPVLPRRGANASQIFETSALAVEGTQTDTYYGSVRWGWRTDDKGAFSQLPLTVVSAGSPSETFRRSAELWNKGKTSTGEETLDLPIADVASIPADPSTMPTSEVVVWIARIDAALATKTPGVDKSNLEFQKTALKAELARRGDQPTTTYADQEAAAVAKGTTDLVTRHQALTKEVAALPLGAAKTDRLIEQAAIEAELPKRKIEVTVHVHETEDWVGADNVYVTVVGFGKSHSTGEQKLNNGDVGTFLIPLSSVMFGGTPGIPFAIKIYDADWPDGNDLMFETSWPSPYSPLTDTQSRDGGRYEATVQFER
jgi:hypothetical protein